MMIMKDIRAILKCSAQKAKRVLKKAGASVTEQKFAHGMKYVYHVTPEQLPEMLADYDKDPEQTAMQLACALSALEGALNHRGFKGEQHATV